MTTGAILTVRDLSVGRGGVRVLAGMNFSVPPGEALVLRGPNGAGKTTLLRSLAGLSPALEGEITLDPDTVAYAGHADGLKAQLSIAENLTFWAQVYGRHDIAPALDAFDLAPLVERRVAELSAGQKRRTSLARLLAMGRAVWLLDEPTVSLDAQNTARFAAAVTAHLDQGGSAIIATHIELGFDAQTLDVGPFAAPPDMRGQDDPFAWEAGT